MNVSIIYFFVVVIVVLVLGQLTLTGRFLWFKNPDADKLVKSNYYICEPVLRFHKNGSWYRDPIPAWANCT